MMFFTLTLYTQLINNWVMEIIVQRDTCRRPLNTLACPAATAECL